MGSIELGRDLPFLQLETLLGDTEVCSDASLCNRELSIAPANSESVHGSP